MEFLKALLFALFIVFSISVYQLLVLQLSKILNELIDIHRTKKLAAGKKINKIKTGAAAEIESEIKKNFTMDHITASAKRVEERAEKRMRAGHEKEEV
jgi:hypothetical protein